MFKNYGKFVLLLAMVGTLGYGFARTPSTSAAGLCKGSSSSCTDTGCAANGGVCSALCKCVF